MGGEIRNLSTFIKFMDCKNGFSITFFFLLSVCILWIGAQFPQEIYLSYGRISTFHYYCSLFICILTCKVHQQGGYENYNRNRITFLSSCRWSFPSKSLLL